MTMHKFDTCPCQVRVGIGSRPGVSITYCPLHKAAPALLEALERIAAGELGKDDGVGADLNQAYHAQMIARAAIAQATNAAPAPRTGKG